MTLSRTALLLVAVLVSIFHNSVAPPVTQKPEVENDILENIGVEYKRYLQEVVTLLESDDEFRTKLEKAEDADLRNGKIAQELQYVRHDVRSKLDELKRAELERLRHYIRRRHELVRGLDSHHMRRSGDQAGHIDESNPHSFEIADLEKLIAKTTQHLAEADRKRREEFKQYEMQKEFERHQTLKTMTAVDGDRYDEILNGQRTKMLHRQKKLHHPGSRKQLEEVWEKQDHMNAGEFHPKTFFFFHDVDGNGYLDQEEVKALFVGEMQKMYIMGYAGEDLREREEELERMREHVFSEADTNRDGLISMQEWIELTQRPDFNQDPGWKGVNAAEEYTRDEYQRFEAQRQKEIDALIAQGKLRPRKETEPEDSYMNRDPVLELMRQHDRYSEVLVPMSHVRKRDFPTQKPLDAQQQLHGQQPPVQAQQQAHTQQSQGQQLHGQQPPVQAQQQAHTQQSQGQQLHGQQPQSHAQQQAQEQANVHPQKQEHPAQQTQQLDNSIHH